MIRPLARRAAGLAAAVLASSALVVTTLAGPASASDVAEAQDAVNELGRKVEIAAEEYNETRELLRTAAEQAEAAAARAESQAGVIAELERQMALLAVEAFKRGGVDVSIVSFFTTSPGDALRAAGTVDVLAGRQNASARTLRAAYAQLQADEAAAAAKVEEVTALEEALAAKKADIEQQLADAEETLAAAERAQAERIAAAAAARAAQEASRSRDAGGAGAALAASSGGGTPVAAGCGTTAPNANVKKVLDFACAQLGKPYQWGAAGPNSYDCSGFTLSAWRQAGVSLPHSSRMQYSGGAKVDRSQLRPGDLVFAYSPISHVGIYLGNNQMIHAPTTGDVVKISSLSYFPYAGAVRPPS